MITPEMVKAVREYAAKHADYNSNGWDIIVECYGDEEVREGLEDALNDGKPMETEQHAIDYFSWLTNLLHEQRREIGSTAF